MAMALAALRREGRRILLSPISNPAGSAMPATSMHCRMIMENKHSSFRQFSVFNEFSKQLKGEAKSNPEFRQSIKELNEKIGIAKEDLEVRTKKTTEKLYKSVDVAWTEAEAASKKIAEDMRERRETSDNRVVHEIQDFKSMNFVRNILEEDEQYSRKKNRDSVHVLLIKNKTFVTVTDARGNKKTGASAGCLEERKGRSRRSRYAAEATAEHVGRSARKMGLKSVVMKVKGSTFFRKKNKVILSWREGFRGEGVGDQSPITYIHDVTQLPHNGCRLPKKRRV